MSRLHSLYAADIFRDGGSYEAIFIDQKGARFVIYLEAHRNSPERHRLRHGRLFAYYGEKMPLDAKPIAIGSPDERELLHDLEVFLAAPRIEKTESSGAVSGCGLKRLTEMAVYIPKREDS